MANPSYILKTYHGQQHEEHYRYEVRAFTQLLHNPTSTEHVAKCYATFRHGETFNFVMEWVGGGDLLRYSPVRSATRLFLSMQEAADYRKAKKRGGRIEPKVERVIQQLVSILDKRDIFFLIDDTESMKEHSVNVQTSFQTLAYIAKSMDPDELELSFVSTPYNIIKNRKTSPLLVDLKHHLSKHVSVEGRIERSLSTLINERIMKRLPISIPLLGQIPAKHKPITVFVFTDGKWGRSVQVGNGLTVPIRNLMREMKRRGLNRTHVMFQFLRFGNDEKGKEHLDYLDYFGEEEDWFVSHSYNFRLNA